jgi:LysR family hydrogen peroxide-inducible transcriptional activator
MQYLVALADLKHFGRAANSANVSQPTLSQQLKKMESQLGVVLVERGKNPVQLTPVGREIADRSRKLLLEVDEIKSLADQSTSGMAGTVRFGISPTLGPYLMPSIVSSLHKKFPNMRLYIREGIPDDQLAELRRGQLDMMIGPMPVVGSDLHLEPLFDENLHIVAAPDHTLCSKQALYKRDLEGYPMMSLDRRHHYHRQIENICADVGALLLHNYEGTSLDSLRQMAGSGLGMVVLPELYMQSEVRGEEIVKKLTITDWSATRSIIAIWRVGSAYTDSYRRIAHAVATKAQQMLGFVS